MLSERNVRQLVRRLHNAVDRRIRLEVQRRREQDWDLRQLVQHRLATDRWRTLRKPWVRHGASGFAAASAASNDAAAAAEAAEAAEAAHGGSGDSDSGSGSGGGSGSHSRASGRGRWGRPGATPSRSKPQRPAAEQNRPAAVAMAAAQAAGLPLKPKRRRRRGARLGVDGAAGMNPGGLGGGLTEEERERQMEDVGRALETVDASLARAAAPGAELADVAATELGLSDKLDLLGSRLEAQQRRRAALSRKRQTLREKMAWLATEA